MSQNQTCLILWPSDAADAEGVNNIKNNKKNSTHKNYKIEALEPRLMMDAEPLDSALESNLDIEQFDSYNFTSLCPI